MNTTTEDTTRYSPDEVAAAYKRAVDEVTGIVGDDAALDYLSALAGTLDASGDYTREQVNGYWNELADEAKGYYNPDEGETGDTIRSDSCGDLVVNLAGGFLDNPDADADDIIAQAWKDLDLPDGPSEPGPERDAAIVEEVVSWVA